MTDRWSATERIFHAALERPVEARAAFLAEACGDDDALRQDVQSLLDEASSTGFLEQPALQIAAGLVTSASLAPLTGQQLGVYRITALLGRGGMGEVYRARDTRLGREVAIKVLPPALTADPDRLARFEREARVLASLNHPHIGMIVRPRRERRHSRRSSSSWSRARRWPSGWRAGRWRSSEALTLGAADCRCAGRGARKGHRPSRSEAGQRQDHAAGCRQGAGLRPGADVRRGQRRPARRASPTITAGDGPHHRDGRLHESGAGAGPAGRQACGRVGVRLRALRAPDRAAGVCRGRPCPTRCSGAAPRAGLDGAAGGAAAGGHDAAAAVSGEGRATAPARHRRRARRTRRRARAASHGTAIEPGAVARAPHARNPVRVGCSRWRACSRLPRSAHWRADGCLHRRRLRSLRRALQANHRRSSAWRKCRRSRPTARTSRSWRPVNGRRQIWIRRLAGGGHALQITHDDVDHDHPRWTPDSSAIVYFTPAEKEGEAGALWEIPALGGTPRARWRHPRPGPMSVMTGAGSRRFRRAATGVA